MNVYFDQSACHQIIIFYSSTTHNLPMSSMVSDTGRWGLLEHTFVLGVGGVVDVAVHLGLEDYGAAVVEARVGL